MNYTEKILNHANKIKELHNIASEAVRKGALSSFTVNDMDHSDMIGKGLYLGLNMTYHAIELEINNIKSMMENGDKEMKEFELKVGDKVFIREDLENGELYGSDTWTNSMVSGVHTVKLLINSGRRFSTSEYDADNPSVVFYYTPEMIDWDKTKELQSKESEMKELTVEMIKELLDEGIEVELECIDRDGFLYYQADKNLKEKMLVLESSLIIDSEKLDHSRYIHIKGSSSFIAPAEYKYFRIKEQEIEIEKEPSATFDDLIGIGLKAVKDGVIFSIEVFEDSIFIFTDSKGYDCNKPTYSIIDGSDVDIERIQEVISHINSLYTETFVIEREEDVSKFNNDIISIVLANGEDVIDLVMFNRNEPYITNGGVSSVKIPFPLLKGATITQKKGGK